MTMTEKSLRITGPPDLLCAVPYLLGFHPEKSLVIVGVADSHIAVTARVDLADLREEPGCLSDTVEAIVRGGTTGIVAVVYTETSPDSHGSLPHAEVFAMLVGEASRAGVVITDCMVVVGDRWWSFTCVDAACCPAEGTVLPPEPTALDAAATYAGMTALPNRQALADMFDPLPDRAHLTAEVAAHQDLELTATLSGARDRYVRSASRALFTAHRAAQAGHMPTDRDVARFAVALQSYAVRDVIWMALDDDRLQGIELWVNLARRMPRPYNAAPLFLAAWRAWRDGNGALAGIAAELALKSDPGYSAAELLLVALSRGINPRTLPKLRMPKGGGERSSTE